MVGVLASSEVDRVFESRSGQTKDYANWYLLFTGWLENMIMCPSGASCLSTDCCFSELELLKNRTKIVGRVQSAWHHHRIEI